MSLLPSHHSRSVVSSDHSSPREKELRNNLTPVGRCPPEVQKDIVQYVANDPLALKNLAHSCTAFSRVITSRDWFRCYQSSNPTWSIGCRFEERPDAEFSSWKRYSLLSLGMQRRLNAPLPPLPDDDAEEPASAVSHTSGIPDTTAAAAATADWTPSDAGRAISGPTGKKQRVCPRLLLDNAMRFNSDRATKEAGFRRIGSPAYYTDYESNTIIAASVVTRPTEGDTKDGAWLKDRQIMFYGLPDLSNPIAICGSECWTETSNGRKWNDPVPVDELQVMQVAEVRHFPKIRKNGAMRVLLVLAFGKGYDSEDVLEAQILDIWRIVRVVEVWLPVDVPPSPPSSPSRSLSSFISSIWPTSPGTPNAAVESKAEPTILKPLGPNPNPWSKWSTMTDEERSVTSAQGLVRLEKGRCETIAPSQHNILFRGRVVKLYTSTIPKIAQDNDGIPAQTEEETVDCITLFGLEYSDSSAALIIKKILFVDKARGDASWSKRMVSRGVSCMTLFPPHSNYGRMMIMVNKHGRGMIWDWVKEKQVAQLHLPVDESPPPQPSSSAEPAAPNVTGSTSSTPGSGDSNNPAESDANASTDSPAAVPAEQTAPEAAETVPVRGDVFYWGVQVSWTVEAQAPPRVDQKVPCSFRIVTLADGEDNQSESCWWHVDSSILGEPEATLEAPPLKKAAPPSTTASHSRSSTLSSSPSPSPFPQSSSSSISGSAPAPTPSTLSTVSTTSSSAPSTQATNGPLYAISQRFVSGTLGYCLPEQLATYGDEDGKPVHTIAYVVWNHYRIGLTTRLGLTIHDIERTGKDDSSGIDQQWITFMDNDPSEEEEDIQDNPLVDIAIVGDNLLITRRHGHMVVPLHGRSF
ncbi:MAG: hypothetical protein J3Q66DRAFT_336756 [Benniella sp.]|nr:MAG: hypothetical protein J3Q66DRAFT_336756 [Benniella sp.]